MPDGRPAAAGASSASASERHGWPVIVGCFLVAIYAWGLGFYGQSIYLAQLQRLHGWPIATISGAVTFFFLAGAALFSLVPPAIARFGARAAMLAGVAAFAAGVSLLPAVSAPWQLYPANLLMAVGWACTSGTAISIVLSQWYVARRGFAISMALNGASAAGFVGAPLMIAAIAAFGFADGLRLFVLGAGALAALAILALIGRPPERPEHPRRPAVPVPVATAESVGRRAAAEAMGQQAPPEAMGHQAAAEAPGRQAAAEPTTRARLLRSGRFWAVAAPFGIAFAAQVGFLAHQVSFVLPIAGSALTATIVAAMAIAAVVGRVLLGLVVDRLEVRQVSTGVVLMQALAFTAMLFSPTSGTVFIACIGFGLGLGALITLPSLLVQREYASRDFALVVALVMTVVQVTYALGPVLLGLLRDLTGDYRAVLAACLLLDIVAATLLWPRRARLAQPAA